MNKTEKFIAEHQENVKKDISNYFTRPMLYEKYNICQYTLDKMLEKIGMNLHHNLGRHKRKNIEKEKEMEVCFLYTSGLTLAEVANKTKIDQHIIIRILRENNVKIITRKIRNLILKEKLSAILPDIKEYVRTNSIHDASIYFNCTKELLFDLLSKKKKNPVISNEQKQTFISMYESGQTLQYIQGKTDVSTSCIADHLKNAGVQMRTNKNYRKYTLYANFFQTIDSHEKAAIFGFLCADGYNCQKEGKVKVGIHKKDIDYLEKINKYIQPDKINPIKFTYSSGFRRRPLTNDEKMDKNIACLTIFCKQMSDDLAKLGCKQAKSLNMEFPSIDPRFLSSFFLGYFDGDGCLSFSNSNTNRRVYRIAMCASDAFAYGAKTAIENLLKIHVGISKKGKISDFYIGGNLQVEKFADWMYSESSVSLDRKHNIYIDMKNYFRKYKDIKFYQKKPTLLRSA